MSQKKLTPPRFAGWILNRIAQYEDNFSLLGDFDEEFYTIARKYGKKQAWVWYWLHFLRSMPVFIKDFFYWRLIMFNNYLKIALRSIRRSKGYSFINIAGLAIGMTCCILILLWVQHELSYDRFHKKADQIYRVCLDADLGSPMLAPVTPHPTAPTLIKDLPEVLNAVRILKPGRVSILLDEKQFQEDSVGYADNSFFEIFTFPFISGDPKTALTAPHTVVITEEMAEKYFRDVDPMGKILHIEQDEAFTITGVIKNIPSNSHIDFNMMRSYETLAATNRQLTENWFAVNIYTYLLLAENTVQQEVEQKCPALVDKYMGPTLNAIGGTFRFFLQPLPDIYLHSNMRAEIGAVGNISYVYLFSGIAFFILLIACFNFINLATARSANRANEVGVRKTFGAVRSKLIKQFLGESIVYCFCSIFLAVILIKLILPVFNSLASRELSINYLKDPWLLVLYCAFALFVGTAAGIYPAFFLSSFHPVSVLKGKLKSGAANSRFRRVLVITQFIISIALIIGTLTIYNQLKYMKTKNLGFDKEHIVVIPRLSAPTMQAFDSIRTRLTSLPEVIDVSASSRVPGRGITKSAFFPEGFPPDKPQTMEILNVNENFFSTLGMEIIAGRNFSKEFSTDVRDAVIINETAVRTFGWDDPIGKQFIFRPIPPGEGETNYTTVIGVVKDFHIHSLHQPIEPVYINWRLDNFRSISIKLTSENISTTMSRLENEWQTIAPNQPFDYFFLDESFDSRYRSEERLGDISLYFSLLAIFIGCLGLFGMASFTAERRTKEIGIRKVLGASAAGIVRLLSKEFVILVGIANILAWPLAYYAMSRWLENFAYRINQGLGTFILAAGMALLITLLTVSYQATKAALTNPADSIRHE